MSAALEQLAERVRRKSGITLDGARLGSLATAVARLGADSPVELLHRLDDPCEGPRLLARLVDEVAVKETFFLRNPDELEALDWLAMLAVARQRGDDRVRVWCTACASGDEAYSLAILALEAFGGAAAPVEILATDVADSALERARAGRYRPRAVAGLPDALRERWFAQDGDALRVRDPVRSLVRFASHNLVEDPIPPTGAGPFDAITCRNVLIYFSPDHVAETVRALRGALAPGGRLVLGAADRLSGVPPVGLPEVPERRPGRLPPARQRARPQRPERRVGPTEPDPALDADVALLLGRAARARGDHGEAVRWLRRTLYLDPSCAVAGLELALAHAALGDVAAERRALWTALRSAHSAGSRQDEELVRECRARLDALEGVR